MGRLHRGGVTGGSGIGDLSVTGTTITSPLNTDVTIAPTGTGSTKFSTDLQINSAKSLLLADSDSSNYVGLKSPASVASNLTFTLPATDGTAGQALVTNGTQVLSFGSAGASLANEIASASTHYVTFTTQTSGALTDAKVATATRPLVYLPSTGQLSATIFNETSSIALKENLVPMTNSLEKILGLQAYTYDRIDGSRRNEPGLIAEEVNEIIPEVVSKNLQGKPESIAYQRLVTYLIESVKKLKQEIDELKQRT